MLDIYHSQPKQLMTFTQVFSLALGKYEWTGKKEDTFLQLGMQPLLVPLMLRRKKH